MTYNQLTTEEFVEKARKVHGDKYDYSKVVYKNWRTNVCIICPEHGEFTIMANSHLQGHGCQSCSGTKRYTTASFIHKSQTLYPNLLRYDECQYVNPKTKVRLYCTTKDKNGVEHGYFKTYPYTHFHGTYGCKKCQYENVGRKLRKTNESFIGESIKVFGDKFKYDKCNYKDSGTDVKLYCTTKDKNGVEHGYFETNPGTHLISKHGGCPNCHRHQHTTESWVKSAKEKHGDTYDYSKTDLDNRDEMGRVLITCRIHGDFWQDPVNHLMGQGCEFCKRGLRKEYKFNLLNEFVDECAVREFLENGHLNILLIITRSLAQTKFDPLKHDIEKILSSDNQNPIKSLLDKYASDDLISPDMSNLDIEVDLDDVDAVEKSLQNKNTELDPTSIDELTWTKNQEREFKVINEYEHLLTPEDREYIIEKTKNDNIRRYISSLNK